MDRPSTSHVTTHKRSFSILRRPRTAARAVDDHGESSAPSSDDGPGVLDWPSTSRFRPSALKRRSSDHSRSNRIPTHARRQKSLGGLGTYDAFVATNVTTTISSDGRRAAGSRLSGLFWVEPPHAREERSNDVQRSQKSPAGSSWLRRIAQATFRGRRREKQAACSGPSEEPTGPLDERPSLNLALPLRGGAAARAAAAAAASNDRVDRAPNLQSRELARVMDRAKTSDDDESGIGIDMQDLSPSECETEPFEPDIIARMDPAGLPEELFHHILIFLDARSLMAAELVSRQWYATAGSRAIWRTLFARECHLPAKALSSCHDDGMSMGGRGTGQSGQVDQPWKRMWQARQALETRWQQGHAAAIYLEGHGDSVYCVQFDETKIVTGSRDQTVRVWDLHTFECLRVLGIPKSASSIAAPLQSTRARMRAMQPVATITPAIAKCVSPRPRVAALNHNGSVTCLQFDQTTMVTGSSDTSLLIWDILHDWLPRKRLTGHRAGILGVGFDAHHIVSCSRDTTICLWDRANGDLLSQFAGHQGPVNAVQLRGEHIVSASGDGTAKLWHIPSGLCVKEFRSKSRGLACVDFSPDGRTILTGGNDKVIFQFDANTGELVQELAGHKKLVRSLHLDAAHGRVVSGSYDHSVKVFELGDKDTTSRLICNFHAWTTNWMLSAKADYRRIVATSHDGRVVVMDFGHHLRDVELLESKPHSPNDAWFC